MQALIVNEMKVLGSRSVKQLLFDDLRDLVLPLSPILDEEHDAIEVPSDPRFQLRQSMESFVTHVAHVSQKFYTISKSSSHTDLSDLCSPLLIPSALRA